ncbi:major facilitator superfamily domain-containing protein [Desarmillaria tabescens]|uniref:Major facilitator superfamily domain-containing protein n=1 Tax=Armillaria tabescens TaxID=1929756 RepID=A0AA39NNP1_ARMTA|nr:major facilitator superfamily domain-containing protein [Desarmillaria tabescens]KAK0469014.1 major facilitator superfamily domain-containing protein [Desarmillaria tabescens]
MDSNQLQENPDIPLTQICNDDIVHQSPSNSDAGITHEGVYAWICLLCSFIVNFLALGIESTWGVYQDYYFNTAELGHVSNSNLAWVGAIQAVGVSVLGFPAGKLAERIGYRMTGIIGCTLMAIGLLGASFSSKVWHLYLNQGIVFAIGSAFAVIPALTIPSQWFVKYRGFATGVGVSGYGIGGLVLSPVTEKLIGELGIRWTLRIMALLTFAVAGAAFIFMKSKSIPVKRNDSIAISHLLKDPVIYALWVFMLLSAFGYYIPTFYTPEYVRNRLQRTAQDGAIALALQAGLSAVGRVLTGLMGDYVGHLTALSICQLIAGIAQMAVWPFCRSLPNVMAFSAVYGFFSGGIVSLPPVVLAEIYGTQQLASITGLILSGNIPGTIVGPSIAGAIIDSNTSSNREINFLPVQLYGGSWFIGGCLATLLVSLLHRISRKRSVGAVREGESVNGAHAEDEKQRSRGDRC